MRDLLAELGRLAGAALMLWRGHFVQLGTWYCLGFGLHHLGRQLSAWLGEVNQLLATLVFVLGVVAWLAALVLMIHTLKPGLTTPQLLSSGDRVPGRGSAGAGAGGGADGAAGRVDDPLVPRQLFSDERALDVMITSIGPFLAVYAVWGFIEDEVTDLFFANLSQRSFDVDYFSVSLNPDRLPFYAGLTVGAWLISKLITVARDRLATIIRRSGAPAGLLVVFADATFVFGLFMTLAIAANQFRTWWQGRVIAVRLNELWRGLLDLLPEWRLWFDLTLPQAVVEAADRLVQTVLPAVADRLLLPLMWLALTATVFGWRQFRGRDVVAGTRLDPAADRLGQVGRRTGSGLIGFVARVATDDLRTKYLPVLTALRVLIRSGAAFIAAYLLLSTLLWSAEIWFDEAVTLAIGPRSELQIAFVIDVFQELITGLIFTTAAVAVYAAAFDRAIAMVTRRRAQRETISR